MPVLAKIQFPEGKNPDVIQRVMTEVCNGLCTALDEKPENVRITVKVVPKNRYSVGGILSSEKQD